jgi:hypothetical protein
MPEHFRVDSVFSGRADVYSTQVLSVEPFKVSCSK